MNDLSRLVTAFLIYMVSVYIALMAMPSILLGTPSSYIRPFQLMVFSNIAILMLYTIVYLALGGKMLSYIIRISLASLAITYYLDIAYRVSQGVRIHIYPLLTAISDPAGSSISIDLGQISIIALALIHIKNKINRRSHKEAHSNIDNPASSDQAAPRGT